MPYRRPNPEKPKEPHALELNFGHYKELSSHLDPAWVYVHLKSNMTEHELALSQLHQTIERVKGLDLSDYKPEVAVKKRQEPLLAARKALLSFIQKQVTEAQKEVDLVRGKMLRHSAPESFKYDKEDLREMRALVRAQKPEMRAAFIKMHPEVLPALVGNPLQGDDIISDQHLLELRTEYAFAQEPSLEMEMADAQTLYKSVRKRAGESHAICVRMLIDSKLDKEAEISPIEFYQAFPPQNMFELNAMHKRVASWQKEQFAAAQKKAYLDKNPGADLASDAGVRLPRNAQEADADKALRRGRSEGA
jgi:hypothetical protein